MGDFNLFIPLKKVDEEQRLIYGTAAEEVVDRPKKEMFDYATSKPHVVAWSNEFAKVTDGKSFGNLRAMHQDISAGKLTDITFDDVEKKIEVVAKVVDDNEWKKVVEGVYTGFSFGGSYGRRWIDDKGQKRYTAIPTELSLGDYPAIPTAHFTLVKIGGEEVEVPFQKTDGDPADAMPDNINLATDGPNVSLLAKVVQLGLTPEEAESALSFLAENVQSEAVLNPLSAYGERLMEKIAKRKDVKPKEGEEKYGDVEFADEKNKKYPIDTAAHIRAAWNYINKAKNAAKYDAEDVKAIKAKIVAAWKKKIDKDGPPSAMKKIASAADLKKYAGEEIWDAQLATQALQYIQSLFEKEKSETEDEGPEQAADLIAAIQHIKSFIASEIMENDPEDDMGLTAKTGALRKTGARHSKSDLEHVQNIHDHAVSLGADCDRVEKLAGSTDLRKLASLETENEALRKENERLKAEPEAAKGPVLDLAKLFAVNKDGSAESLAKTADGKPQPEKSPSDLIKDAHKHPRVLQF